MCSFIVLVVFSNLKSQYESHCLAHNLSWALTGHISVSLLGRGELSDINCGFSDHLHPQFLSAKSPGINGGPGVEA